MARSISTDGGVVNPDGGGGFKPLKVGRYEATVFKLEEKRYASVKNKDRPYLNVEFRISDGQVGANRRLFEKVPLFSKWSDGKDAFAFFRFFAAVTDTDEKEFRAAWNEAAEAGEEFDLPDDVDILGTPVTLTLKIVDDTYAFNKAKETDPDAKQADFQTNAIAAIGRAGGGNMDSDGGEGSSPAPKATILEL